MMTPVVNRTLHIYHSTLRILCEAFQIEAEGHDVRCERRLIAEERRLNAVNKMLAPIIADAQLMDVTALHKIRLLFGVDGVTWDTYGQDLEARLSDLHGRVHRGAYRARPSRRVYIPRPTGQKRPLGIAALEDKVVQRAVVEVLNAISEADFLGFSYGFRPGRGQHHALDALAVGIVRKKVAPPAAFWTSAAKRAIRTLSSRDHAAPRKLGLLLRAFFLFVAGATL